MNSREIEHNLIELVEIFNQDEFIYDLLLAYDITKRTAASGTLVRTIIDDLNKDKK